MCFPAKTLFLALVAALAIPQPIPACAHGGTEFKSCCQAAHLTATHSPECTGGECVCSRPLDPRAPTSDRSVDVSSQFAANFVATVETVPTTFDLAAASVAPVPGGQLAIPHRILHCTWLI